MQPEVPIAGPEGRFGTMGPVRGARDSRSVTGVIARCVALGFSLPSCASSLA
jgi:hypothetical protein